MTTIDRAHDPAKWQLNMFHCTSSNFYVIKIFPTYLGNNRTRQSKKEMFAFWGSVMLVVCSKMILWIASMWVLHSLAVPGQPWDISSLVLVGSPSEPQPQTLPDEVTQIMRPIIQHGIYWNIICICTSGLSRMLSLVRLLFKIPAPQKLDDWKIKRWSQFCRFLW